MLCRLCWGWFTDVIMLMPINTRALASSIRKICRKNPIFEFEFANFVFAATMLMQRRSSGAGLEGLEVA
jgi:hypothetical protein